MSTRLWKRVMARSLSHAFQLCKDFALDKKNMSVERIADRIGKSPDLVYKYLSEGRMPANHIVGFEEACGAMFITQYLAHSHGCMLLKIPSGRKATHIEVNELQKFMNVIVGHLIDLSTDEGNASEAVRQITLLMEDLAFHRNNAEKHQQPELF